MSHIFVSYSHDDGDFVEKLKEKLDEAGFATWMDEEKLRIGENWREQIDQAIRDSLALIVVMTPDAKDSEYVTYEWAFAWGIHIKVLPLKLKSTQLHPRLESLQWLDFSSRGARPWVKLINVLREAEQNELQSVSVSQTPLTFIQRAAEALDNPDPNHRKMAVEGLGAMDFPEALDVLVRALRHPLKDVCSLAMRALGKTKHNEAVPELLNILKHDDIELRRIAIETLGIIGDSHAISELIKCMDDEDQYVRNHAAIALGDIGNIDAVPDLIKALNHQDYGLRTYAARALGKIGDIQALEPLINKTLRDEDAHVRRGAAIALGQLGNPRAVPHLIERLSDEQDPSFKDKVCDAAARSLREIGIPEALEAVEDWEKKSQKIIDIDKIVMEMTRLAKEFNAYEIVEGKKTDLPLLPEPIYTYTDAERDIDYGTVFAFALGKNPEVLISFEKYPESISCELARIGGAEEMHVLWNGRHIWWSDLVGGEAPEFFRSYTNFSYTDLEHGKLFAPEPQTMKIVEKPLLIDTLDTRVKIEPDFLDWEAFSMLFWVRITQNFIDTQTNRYLFSYTTDTTDTQDKEHYPDGFYFGIRESDRGYDWEFAVKGPDPQNETLINFPPSEVSEGWSLFSIRWNGSSREIKLDITHTDSNIRFESKEKSIAINSWPKNVEGHFFVLGDWIQPDPNGISGISLLEFYKFNLFKKLLSDSEVRFIFGTQRASVQKL